MISAISSMIYVSLKPSDVVKRFSDLGVDRIELSYDNAAFLARHGYDEDTVMKEFIEAVRMFGVDVVAGHLPYGEILNRAVNIDEQPKVVKYLEKWVKFYSTIGVNTVAIHIPFNEPAVSESSISYLQRLKSSAISFFKHIAKLSEEYSMFFAIENRMERGVYGYMPQDIVDIISEVGGKYLRMCMDTGHAFINRIDLHEFFRLYRDYIALIHAHDNDGSRDLHLPPLTGKIPWKNLVKELRDSYENILVYEVACYKENSAECDNIVELLLAIDGKLFK